MSRSSRAEWAKRVERWRDSGLTAREFATETGLKATTLSYWKWRLGSERRAKSAQTLEPKRVRPRSCKRSVLPAATPPRFVEVTSPPPAASTEALALELPGGIVVRVHAGFDEVTLGRVLRVVRSAP